MTLPCSLTLTNSRCVSSSSQAAQSSTPSHKTNENLPEHKSTVHKENTQNNLVPGRGHEPMLPLTKENLDRQNHILIAISSEKLGLGTVEQQRDVIQVMAKILGTDLSHEVYAGMAEGLENMSPMERFLSGTDDKVLGQ